ncbi:hypothetical protein LEMLEM_LOCUS27917 [Lemmus lemmus]
MAADLASTAILPCLSKFHSPSPQHVPPAHDCSLQPEVASIQMTL